MANLIVLSGARKGHVQPIEATVVVGRGVRADLRIPDYLVSTLHAEIRLEGDQFRLVDLGSTNGTLRNGVAVASVPITFGDTIHVGGTELLFTDETRPLPLPPLSSERGGVLQIVELDAGQDMGTTALSMVHALEQSLRLAPTLDRLLHQIARTLVTTVRAKKVAILLAGRPEAERFVLRAESLGGMLETSESLQVPPELEAEGWQREEILLGRRAGSLDLLVPLRFHDGKAVALVYLHDTQVPEARLDRPRLNLVSNLGGVHLRSRLLVSELKERNEHLETLSARLASWNEELQREVARQTTELRRSEQSYRELFEESRDGNMLLDERGRVTRLNATGEEILGLDAKGILGRPVWEVLGPETAGVLAASRPETDATQTQEFACGLQERPLDPNVIEVPLETSQGEVVIEVLSRPLTNEGEQLVGVHAVLRDVTLRHEERRRLLLLSRVVENVGEAVVSMTLDGEVTSWNPGAERLYGYTAKENLGELLPTVPDHLGAEFERILESAARGERLALRTERIRSDATVVPVFATYAPVYAADGRVSGLVEIARDLTEQLRLEDRIRGQERWASFGELAVGLAHELGNPLANLRSVVDFLQARRRSEEEAKDAVGRFQEEIERLDRLVQQALRVGRWEAPTLEEVDLAELLDYVVASVSLRAEQQSVELIRGWTEGARVQGDRDQLKQALINVTGNALEAMPEGGRLHFDLLVDEELGQAKLVVTDSGRGIPHDVQGKIFNLFFTLRPGGTGVGLAIVKRIIEMHRGRVEIESEPGEGTVVRFALPLARADAPARANHER